MAVLDDESNPLPELASERDDESATELADANSLRGALAVSTTGGD
jgi:hypothetical protein